MALVLHTLEPDEELSARHHVRHCTSCRAAMVEAALVLTEIAAAVPPADPAPGLRESLLARVAETAQVLARIPVHRIPVPRRPAENGAVAEPDPAALTPIRPAPIPRRALLRRRLVAAALVVGIVGVGGLATFTTQVLQQRDAQAAQTRSLAAVVTELGRADAPRATLTTPDGTPVASVLFVGGQRTVVATGLAPNDPGDSVYVVWGFTPAGPQAIGTFDVAASGVDVSVIGPPTGPPCAGYAISREPGRTAPAVPGTVVAAGALKT